MRKKKKGQFIAGEQKPLERKINWQTGRLNKLSAKEMKITPRQQRLIDRGLLHINVHHPRCKQIAHPRMTHSF